MKDVMRGDISPITHNFKDLTIKFKLGRLYDPVTFFGLIDKFNSAVHKKNSDIQIVDFVGGLIS
jgi:hypothetical protein